MKRFIMNFIGIMNSMIFKEPTAIKTVLEIRFPAASSEQIYQIAMLLQELLISVLPEGAAYLSILAKRPENFSVKYSSVISDADDIEDHSLLVIEDSDMDLGLLDELENYFFRLMEIVQDCLRWTYESKRQNQKKQEMFLKELI